ncbi:MULTISPECIES: DUF6515 family protein [unclassified Olleya]|uniref:DUF6515 family protein n=1 Tax=unclassified Olleya TaxID=2615019 RepID=UPI000C3097A7|nr:MULTISPECIES: DUF6515 family protein [unclassified Olleya]AUC76595.1 hypothetical protein CW732_13325 [Olleya sp. Bg11-27]QXP58912.1 hypothetical protein H0I26_13440 [Olleya sp. HaHaR_3_96]
MKALIKTYIVPFAFLIALTTQVSAQSKRDTRAKTTKATVAKKRTIATRVSSKAVVYKTPKRKVVSVRTVPNRTVIVHKGHNYYYANNKYYTQSRGRYIAIAPKVGFKIKVLPTNSKRIRYNNHNYYNAYGIFYVQVNNEYEVVEPEVGTLVYELPDDYEKVVINDETYYEYANVLYEKTQVNGARAYEVVGIIDMD